MRFLKNKIMRAQQASAKQVSDIEAPVKPLCLEDDTISTSEHSTEASQSPINYAKTDDNSSKNKSKRSKVAVKKRKNSPMKNMALNYGKAIASFAVSHLAVPYLALYLEREGVKMAEFIKFMKDRKDVIKGISGFRVLLLIEEEDTEKVIAYKRVFQAISEVFIKYFSVNWIMNGRLADKMTYMKFRFNMLRRVQNPESFTYIKERERKSGKKY